MRNLRIKGIVLYFLIVFAPKAFGQMPDSVKTYIDSALYLMQSKSLFSKSLPWTRIHDSTYLLAKNAKTYQEAFPAIAYAFRQLKDHHGMVADQDTSYRYPSPVNFDNLLSKGIKKEFLKGNRIVTAYLPGEIAYLRVPSMNVFSQADIDKRARMLRDSLCLLLAKKPKRLIIDLRMNSGGNSAPMISGLSPLFRDSVLGYGVDRDGKFLSPTIIREGVTIDENGNKQVNLNSTCTEKVTIPLAVLTGPSTVSSGEILAVFLKQLKQAKTFGEPTPGFCNATEGFLFMNNKGYLLLTVNKVADAKKNIYHDMLVRPDVYVKSDDNYDDLLSDPTVTAAVTWLSKK